MKVFLKTVVSLFAVASLMVIAPGVMGQEQGPISGADSYISECAGCHGPRGGGTAWAPEIREQGAAGADFMMRTGRMPLRSPDEPVRRSEPVLTPEQIDSITEFVATLGGPSVPDPRPERGDPGLGAELYLINCAACHGATGVGAALVNSDNAPDLFQATPLEVAEAVRSGPRSMPGFGRESIDEHQLDSLVLYVSELTHAENNRGGWSLGRWGPVAEGAAAWLLGIIAVIGAAAWVEGSGQEKVGGP